MSSDNSTIPTSIYATQVIVPIGVGFFLLSIEIIFCAARARAGTKISHSRARELLNAYMEDFNGKEETSNDVLSEIYSIDTE